MLAYLKAVPTAAISNHSSRPMSSVAIQVPIKSSLLYHHHMSFLSTTFDLQLFLNLPVALGRPKLHAVLAFLSAVGLTSTRVSLEAVLVASSRAVSKLWHICA